MSNAAPFEILAQPYTVWLAPVGTPFPDLDVEPEAPWFKVGTNGDLNYTEDGVTVSHSQSVEQWRALGATGPRKVFRTEEEFKISFVLADMSLEQYGAVLNDNLITEVAAGVGTIGTKKIGLHRGLNVHAYALLARGDHASPYGDWPAQYEVPHCVQIGEQEITNTKGEPAALQLEFVAIEDQDAATTAERFGRFVAQSAEAET
jgi:hypothetical protein